MKVRALFAVAPVVFAASLVACASGKSARGPADAPSKADVAKVASFYPLGVGNEWTYELSVPGGQKKQDTIKIVKQEAGWFVDDHRGKLRVDSEGLRDADRYLLRGPIEAGSKWTAVEDLVVQKFEITSADASEITPAGTFLHCVTVRNEQPLGPKKGKFITEWSYAPGVGLVKMKTSVEDGGQTLPQMSLGLVAFRVR